MYDESLHHITKLAWYDTPFRNIVHPYILPIYATRTVGEYIWNSVHVDVFPCIPVLSSQDVERIQRVCTVLEMDGIMMADCHHRNFGEYKEKLVVIDHGALEKYNDS